MLNFSGADLSGAPSPDAAGFTNAFATAFADMARPPARVPMAASARTRDTSAALADVLRHPGIWRRGSAPRSTIDTLSTGFAELDAELAGGGLARGALTEILIGADGLGECSLLLPALATLTQSRRRVALIAPPYLPFAPALAAAGIDLDQLVHIDAGIADMHWTAEQCLRAGCCGAVLNWLPRADYRQLRRLQLAAETGAAIGFVFLPLGAASESSPSALRLCVRADDDGVEIDIIKCRGRVGMTRTRLCA